MTAGQIIASASKELLATTKYLTTFQPMFKFHVVLNCSYTTQFEQGQESKALKETVSAQQESSQLLAKQQPRSDVSCINAVSYS